MEALLKNITQTTLNSTKVTFRNITRINNETFDKMKPAESLLGM